jgi:hypothetical protein
LSRGCCRRAGFFFIGNGVANTRCAAGGNHEPLPNLNLMPRIR